MEHTHRSAIDNMNTLISTTYCGLTFNTFDDCLSNDPTCPECREQLRIDRVSRGRSKETDPEWIKNLFI